jgi:hypothetical protein
MPNPVHKRRLARRAAQNKKIDINIVEEYVEPMEESEISGGVVTNIEVVMFTEEELTSKYKSELVEIAEELGLDTAGTKAELIEKILEV